MPCPLCAWPHDWGQGHTPALSDNTPVLPPAELSLCLLSLSFAPKESCVCTLVRNSIVTQCPLCWQVLSLAPR